MLRIAAVLSSLLLLAACNWSDTHGGPAIKGSGNILTETRQVENFRAIVVSGSANLEIEQTGEEGLEITTDDNLLPLYTTEVRNGTLYIEVAEGKRLTWSGKGPRIKVTVREMRKLKVSGAVSVKATKLDTDSLSITRWRAAPVLSVAICGQPGPFEDADAGLLVGCRDDPAAAGCEVDTPPQAVTRPSASAPVARTPQRRGGRVVEWLNMMTPKDVSARPTSRWPCLYQPCPGVTSC